MTEYDAATIHDFVNQRWLDAKCALRQLDSQFVDKMEHTVLLQDMGLHTSWEPNIEEKPKRPLSKQWHLLLEACMELTMQVSRFQVAVDSLSAGTYLEMAPVDVGKRVSYHFNSLVIHADVLSEHITKVIRRTIDTYVHEGEKAKKLRKLYQERVDQAVSDLKGQRNTLVHARRSYMSAITVGEFWEGNVAMNITPQTFLDELHWSSECKRLRSGVYAKFGDAARMWCDSSLAPILGDLEKDVQKGSK